MPPRSHRKEVTDPAALLPTILRNLESSPPDAYSAHQKARTTAARLAQSGHNDAAIEVLFGSAKELLKIKEYGSGCDLAVYLVQVYQSAEIDVSSDSRARLTQLLALMTSEGAWRKKLAGVAIKWSSDFGDCPLGDPDLHQYIGELYYKDRAFAQAEAHLVAACKRDAASLLADMMFEWCQQGKIDPGPFACHGVLPYLSIQPPAILPAQAFISKYLSLLASAKPSIMSSNIALPIPSSGATLAPTSPDFQLTVSPTLNFLQLAIFAVQRAPREGTSGVQARGTTGGVGREWEALVRRYKGTGGAMASEAVQEAILHISTNIFLIPPPRGAGGGADMLQNLMGSLFGGGGGAPPGKAVRR